MVDAMKIVAHSFPWCQGPQKSEGAALKKKTAFLETKRKMSSTILTFRFSVMSFSMGELNL